MTTGLSTPGSEEMDGLGAHGPGRTGPVKFKKGDYLMGKLQGKKLLLLGERDGVPSPAMEAVFKDSGAELVFSATECFV